MAQSLEVGTPEFRKDSPNRRDGPRFEALMVLAGHSSVPLRLSPTRRAIAGVCGGIAEWLGIDPWWIRTLFVGLTIFAAGFPGLCVYIAFWIGMPRD